MYCVELSIPLSLLDLNTFFGASQGKELSGVSATFVIIATVAWVVVVLCYAAIVAVVRSVQQQDDFISPSLISTPQRVKVGAPFYGKVQACRRC